MTTEHTPQTTLHARDTEIVVGPDKPFVMIGERINPTNRAKLSETMESHDMSVVIRDAEAQVAAGAQVLDINVGTAFGEESEIMALAVKAVLSVVDVPLCIDSSDPAAIAAGLVAYREVCGKAGKPLINSTTAEAERLDFIAPLAAEYGAAVIGLTNDEEGIPETPERRFELAVAIMDRMAEEGVPRDDLLIDGLTLTVGADHNAALCTMEVTERVTRELSLNTTSGASNVSFGLPGRKDLNTAFLAMMMTKGLTSAITNPLKPEIIATVRAADLFLGLDSHALGWIQFFRGQQAK
jgi:5-methyltetrahydrofolate--homocysteine methyltransferase